MEKAVSLVQDNTPACARRPGAALCVALCAGAIALSAATYVLWRFAPSRNAFYPPCLFHMTTGLHCPGCGTLRGLHALLHGRVIEALGHNALTIIALPLLAYAGLAAVMGRLGRPLPMPRLHPALPWVAAAMYLLFGLLRNIPVYPFSLLAP